MNAVASLNETLTDKDRKALKESGKYDGRNEVLRDNEYLDGTVFAWYFNRYDEEEKKKYPYEVEGSIQPAFA